MLKNRFPQYEKLGTRKTLINSGRNAIEHVYNNRETYSKAIIVGSQIAKELKENYDKHGELNLKTGIDPLIHGYYTYRKL